jgi:hypothetical protein
MQYLSPCVAIQPPLEQGEITFLAAFAAEAEVRRVWPGQPTARSPWRPSPDGRSLELDIGLADAEPECVAGWLRFLSRRFLAPSTAASLDDALSAGLRGGHRLSGEVVVGGGRWVRVANNRVTEREAGQLCEAVVLDFDAHRRHAVAQRAER